jgi:hypothetical protein
MQCEDVDGVVRAECRDGRAGVVVVVVVEEVVRWWCWKWKAEIESGRARGASLDSYVSNLHRLAPGDVGGCWVLGAGCRVRRASATRLGGKFLGVAPLSRLRRSRRSTGTFRCLSVSLSVGHPASLSVGLAVAQAASPRLRVLGSL